MLYLTNVMSFTIGRGEPSHTTSFQLQFSKLFCTKIKILITGKPMPCCSMSHLIAKELWAMIWSMTPLSLQHAICQIEKESYFKYNNSRNLLNFRVHILFEIALFGGQAGRLASHRPWWNGFASVGIWQTKRTCKK